MDDYYVFVYRMTFVDNVIRTNGGTITVAVEYIIW